MLLAQGRNVRACDMQLLDLESMGKSEDNRYYIVRGNWDPAARGFKELVHLNDETPKGFSSFFLSTNTSFSFRPGARVFLTIALDLVISGIHEPVRFLIESKARVCLANSKGDILSQDLTDSIWAPFKKTSPLTEEFEMILKEVRREKSIDRSTGFSLQVGPKNGQDETYEVISLESKSEAERKSKLRQTAAGKKLRNCLLVDGFSSATVDDDDDEPMVSGFGHVSKECDEEVLGNWSDILVKWRKNYNDRPRGLQTLVRRGENSPSKRRNGTQSSSSRLCRRSRGVARRSLATVGRKRRRRNRDDQHVSPLINKSSSKGRKNVERKKKRFSAFQESSCERVILNDLNRTFPAHEYFKEAGGVGQEALYKLSRVRNEKWKSSLVSILIFQAYSVRDEEVGYCQGLSFVIATLLIHVRTTTKGNEIRRSKDFRCRKNKRSCCCAS